MRHRIGVLGVKMVLALWSVLVLSSCGGEGGSPTSPTPTGPRQATITVSCGQYDVSFSPRVGFSFRLTAPCTVTESTGLGANMNFVRLNLTLGGVLVERHDISSADIMVQTGSNRLNASQARSSSYTWDFNRGDATGGTIEFGFTDDRGNNLVATFTLVV